MLLLPLYNGMGELLGYVNADDVLIPVPVKMTDDPNEVVMFIPLDPAPPSNPFPTYDQVPLQAFVPPYDPVPSSGPSPSSGPASASGPSHASDPAPSSPDAMMTPDVSTSENPTAELVSGVRGSSQTQGDEQGRRVYCVFCRYRKNYRRFYQTHRVTDDEGFVTCPRLSRVVCRICGATGKVAHTLLRCPHFQAWKNNSTLPGPGKQQ